MYSGLGGKAPFFCDHDIGHTWSVIFKLVTNCAFWRDAIEWCYSCTPLLNHSLVSFPCHPRFTMSSVFQRKSNIYSSTRISLLVRFIRTSMCLFGFTLSSIKRRLLYDKEQRRFMVVDLNWKLQCLCLELNAVLSFESQFALLM